MGGQRYKILVVVARLININLLLGRQTKAVAGWADFLKKYIFAIAIAIPKMIHEELARQIARQFAYPFTADQHEAVNKLARFVVTPRRSAAFILRGYAGTGKTSLVGALVKVLTQLKREVVLLAPTGRAAKVFSLHSVCRLPPSTAAFIGSRLSTERVRVSRWGLISCNMRSLLWTKHL